MTTDPASPPPAAPDGGEAPGCAEPECTERHYARGRCQRHYDRMRFRLRTVSDGRRAYSRARSRATARLVAEHRDRFAELVSEELASAQQEIAELPPGAQLLPGTRPDGETVTDRLRTDVGTCRRCHVAHDAEHRCPACGFTDRTGEPVDEPEVHGITVSRPYDDQVDGPVLERLQQAIADKADADLGAIGRDLQAATDLAREQEYSQPAPPPVLDMVADVGVLVDEVAAALNVPRPAAAKAVQSAYVLCGSCGAPIDPVTFECRCT